MEGGATGSPKSPDDERAGTDVSIVLLCYNGDRYLDEVLRAIFSQKTTLKFEVLAIDSGSSDRTLEILSRYPVTTHEIPNKEFGHGKTRNLGGRMANGRFVVFLTQDATPAHDTWLDNLLATLLENPDVAGAYSRQLPRDDCNPIERRDVEVGAGPIMMVKRVDFEDPYEVRNYQEHKHEFMLFSNVSSCVRKTVLDAVRFNELLPMVEDQEWCQRVIEEGHAVIYESRSAVYHSHNHSLGQIYARHREYGASYREFTDFSTDLRKILVYVLRESLADALFVLRQRGSWFWKTRWMLESPVVRCAMRLGLREGLAGTKRQAPCAPRI